MARRVESLVGNSELLGSGCFECLILDCCNVWRYRIYETCLYVRVHVCISYCKCEAGVGFTHIHTHRPTSQPEHCHVCAESGCSEYHIRTYMHSNPPLSQTMKVCVYTYSHARTYKTHAQTEILNTC
jgi:hypothetical protein